MCASRSYTPIRAECDGSCHADAIEAGYRFYSYGDVGSVLPNSAASG